MSIQRFEPGDIEYFTIQTTPGTTYVSSSLTGTTGSAYVYPRRSNAIKDYHVNWVSAVGASTGAYHQINDINDVLGFAKTATTTTELHDRMAQYLGVVSQQPQNVRNKQKQEIFRSTPGVNLDMDMTRKFVTTNVLMPYYSSFGTNYNFGYTNYHSLNFLTASGLPSDTALIYPATGSANGTLVSSSYIPSGAFSFDFYLNPRYTNDAPGAEFKAGTLFHLSGTYAVSLISGSACDSNGYTNAFRLLLQLSSSADILPSTIDPNNLPSLTYVSNDNVLQRNTWNHITVRWGTQTYNFGSGSFVVNGIDQGTFYLPSASIAPTYDPSHGLPSMLTIGNFLEASTDGSAAYYFSDLAQTRFGVPVSASAFILTPPNLDQPPSASLNHPLNAEVHELKIYNKYLGRDEIASRSLSGAPAGDPNLLFYLPPLFTKESPWRAVDTIVGQGGVLVHPFQNIDGTTEHPFNVDLSFDTGGHYINLENFTRDFATGNYPRLINLTGSALLGNTEQRTANEFLYASGSNRKASLTVLPCDNGLFVPNWFELLHNLNTSSFTTDHNLPAFNLISLREMYSLQSIYDLVPPSSGSATLNTDNNPASIIGALSGFDATSSYGTLNPQRTPTILQRTQENGSLQVVMFDISNLFYGNKIKPGTFVLSDSDLSNSYGKVAITLKDDGFGSLYRADSVEGSVLAQSNCVGNIFYDNGIVLIQNPSLYWFGQNGFSCSFQGERNVHVMKSRLYANPLELVSSSNPSWNSTLQASDAVSDFDKRYVYITDLYIHDDNLNVIAKTKMAQNVLKRTGDKLVFDVKIDF